jgi:hypothetical protein
MKVKSVIKSLLASAIIKKLIAKWQARRVR